MKLLILLFLVISCDFDNNLLGSNPDIEEGHRPLLGDEKAEAPKVLSPEINDYISNPIKMTGSCTPGYEVVISSVELIENPMKVTCTNSGGFELFLDFIPGVDGVKNLNLIQNDPFGKSSPNIVHSLILDTVPPGEPSAPTSPIAGSSNNANVNFTATGDCVPGDTVTIKNPNLTTNPLEQECDNSGNYSIPAEFKENSDGIQAVEICYTDPAGNTSDPFEVSIVVDSTAPGAPLIAVPQQNSFVPGNPSTFIIAGTCSAGDTIKVSHSQLTGTPISTACGGTGTYSETISFSGVASNGIKTLSVTAEDTAGNISSPSSRDINLDSIAPNNLAVPTSPVASARVNSPTTITGACSSGDTISIAHADISPNPATGNCSGGNYNISLTFSSDGAKALDLTAIDPAGNISGITSHSVTADNTPPGVLTLPTTPVVGTSIAPNFTMTGSCEAGAEVRITNSNLSTNPTVTTCGAGTYSVGLTLSGLGDGAVVFTLQQYDVAGNASPIINASYSQDSVDPVAPMVIAPIASSRVAGTFTLNGTCEGDSSVDITSLNLSAPINFTCSNAGTFSESLTFNGGTNSSQTISLVSTDGAGNSSSITTHALIVDDVDPTTPTMTAPTAASTVGLSETLSGTCSTGDIITISGTFLDPSITTTCSGNSYSATGSFQAGVASSAETLSIQAKDEVGNTSSTTHGLTVNTAASAAPGVVAPANGDYVQLAVNVNGSCDGVAFTVNIYNSNLAANPTAIACTGANTFAGTVNFNSGTIGPQSLEFKQTNGVESNGEIVGVNVDTTASGAPSITSHNDNDYSSGTMTLEGTCAPNDTINIANANLSSNPTSGVCNAGGAYSIALTWSSGNGSLQTLSVTEDDQAGNTSTASTVDLNIDLSVPAAPVVALPTSGDTVGSSASFDGTCEIGATVSIASATLSVNPTETICDSSGEFSVTANFLSSASGSTPTINVTQSDLAGNTSAADSLSITIDGSAPTVVTISAPTGGDTVGESFTVSGACETNSVVRVKNDSLTPNPTTVVCSGSAYSVDVNYNSVNGSNDGVKTISVDQVDNVGNSSQEVSVVVSVDTVAPSKPVLPTSPMSGSDASDPVTVAGLCNSGEIIVFNHADLSPREQTASCTNGTYSLSLDWNGAASDGVKTLTILARDTTGNESSTIDYLLTLDTAAPVFALPTSPSANTKVPISPKSVKVSGQCAAGDTVTFTGGGIIIPSPAESRCEDDGTYEIPLTYLVAGSQSVDLTMTDPAGNTSAALTYTLDVDNTPPTQPTIISLTPEHILSGDKAPNVIWTNPAIADLDDIEYALGTVSGTDNVVNWKSVGLATSHEQGGVYFTQCNGAAPKYYISLRSKDIAGNESSVETSSFFYYDSTAPTVPGAVTVTAAANSTTSASISWSPSTEACDFDRYEIAISTTNDESGIISGGEWTSTGTTTNGSISGITLDISQSYYMLVKAIDVAKNESAVIASSAWSAADSLTLVSSGVVGSTNLNQTSATAMSWELGSVNTETFSFSSGSSGIIRTLKAGTFSFDYTIPVMAPIGCTRCQVKAEIYVNGSPVNYGVSASSYIRYATGQTESSLHFSGVLVLSVNDQVEVRVSKEAGSGTINTSGAQIFMELLANSESDFMATTSRSTNSTNLNDTTAYSMEWNNSFKDVDYTHDDSVNKHQITLAAGDYLVYYSIPLQLASVSIRTNIKAYLTMNTVAIPDTAAAQGYIRNETNHDTSSLHYYGVLRGVSASDVLELKVEREAGVGTVEVMGSRVGMIYLRKIDSSSNYVELKTNTTQTGTNYNGSTVGLPLAWGTQNIMDAGVYAHNTGVSNHELTVLEAGAYRVIYNDFLDNNSARQNIKIVMKKNGVKLLGTECATHYARNDTDHDRTSCSFSTVVGGIGANDKITVEAVRESSAGGTVTAEEDSTLILIKK